VTAFRDRADELRLSLPDPRKDEKRAAHVELVEHVEQALGISDDAALHRCPSSPRHDAVEHADVEVILDIDAHCVDDRLR
jgi:hypothetical protein